MSRMLADRILFIDAEAIVLDKPAGMPVDVPRDGAMAVENHLASLRFGFERWPVPVHRLDRDTSGCLLLARNPRAAKRLGQAFEAGKVEKVYLAVLSGVPGEAGGLIDLALGKQSTREDGWRIVPDARGKAARTAWRVLRVAPRCALVELRPETGRTHQLRVHMASGLGCPIVGDAVYGAGGDALLLHAHRLVVPRAGKPPVEAEAPLPDRFPAALREALDAAA